MRIPILSTLMFLLITQAAPAQVAPLEMIPASAAVVIRLQAPESTTRDLTAFLNKVQPGVGDLAKAQLPALLGRIFFNPTLDGADQTRDWYVVLFADETPPLRMVLFVPAKEIAELKDAMGSSVEFLEKDGWLACSKKDDFLGEFERCFSGDAKAISTILDDRTKSTLMTGHVGVVVNAPPLKEAFADELASAEQRLEDLIEGISAQLSIANPGMDLGYVFDIYRDFGRMMLQGVRDADSVALSVKVTNDAVQIGQVLTVAAGSKTDAFFLTQPVSDMARLTSVPQGLAGYMGIHGNPAVLLDWSERLMASMFKDEELKEKTAKSIAMMRKVKFGTIAVGGDLLPDEDTSLRYFGVSEISPSSVVRESLKLLGTGVEYEIAGIRQKQSFEMDAETIDGLSVDIYRMEQTMPPGLDPTGMSKALNEKMYGPDGIVQRIAIKGDLMLQTMGGGPESMKRLMSATSWSDSQLLEARGRQHEKANLLMLVDVPNGVLKFAKLILGTGAVPVPVQPEQLDGLVIAPSYAGFSIAVEKQGLSARTSIPVETFQGFVQIGLFGQQLSGQLQ